MSESSVHNAAPKAGLKAGKLFRKEESRQRHASTAIQPFFAATVSRDMDTEATMPDIQSLFIPGIRRTAPVQTKCAEHETEDGIKRKASTEETPIQTKCAECEHEEEVKRKAPEEETPVQAKCAGHETEDELKRKAAEEPDASVQRAEEESVQAKCAECEHEEEIKRKAPEESGTPVQRAEEESVQAKCAECEHEEEIKRKAPEETEAPVQRAAEEEESVQAKCADCEGMEKLHTKSDEAPLPVQASLKVGKPDDPQEIEADRMAEKVLRMPQLSFTGGGGSRPEGNGNTNNNVQRSEEEGEEILTKPIKGLQRAGDGSFRTSDSFSARLKTSESGSPLPEPVRGNMESAFQADFSAVRIHTGTEAASLSKEIGAQAFAYQHHIYFGENKYQPESTTGRFLLAHELTHTVQQGAAKTVQRDEENGEEKETSWTDMLLSGAESVLESHLPADIFEFYKDIKTQGVLGYIKNALFGLFRELFNGLGFSDEQFMLIIQIFIHLKNQLPAILDGLSKGDCKPLFAALNLLSTVVKAIAGAVWDKLMETIEPLRQWLNKIWDTYMAPAIDKVTAFAGKVWDRIKDFGRWIWNKFDAILIQPYRTAWEWICKKLGIESSDEGGFMDFVWAKLNAVWEFVKMQLRPVIEPIQAVISGIGAMINMDAIRKMQEDATQWLDKVADTATAMGNDDDAVANKQMTLRDVLLPALNKSIDRIKVTIIAAGQWVLEKVNNIAVNVNSFFSGLQSNEYLSPVYSLVSWVPRAIDSLKNWAEDKVVWIFERIYAGMEDVRAFMQRVIDMLLKLVDAAGNLLGYLGDFILGPFALVPKCIKDPVMDWLTEVILKKIPVIAEFIDLKEKWPQIKAAALTVIKQVFVDGKLARGLWTFFRNLLSLIGIDPTLVTAVIAKAAHNFSDIIKKPGEFLKNVWNVIKGGFVRFYDNLGTHMLHGALEWLFGEVKGAVAVAPPADFSLRNILGYVLDLFGINMENVYKRMEENPKIGKERVAKMRKMQDVLTGALEWVTVWIKEGAEGLLRKAKAKLDDLTDMVISGIVSWVSEKISAEIMKRLATSADPLGIGATINTLILVYDTMKTGIAYVNKMLNLANQAMDNLAEIIGGKLEHAQVAFEEVLAKAVPVVIGFSVEVIIGPVGDKIKDIVTAGRKKVDDAIDWLINGALSVIDTILKAGKAALNKVLGWLGLRKEFKAEDGEMHTISFAGSETSAQLMVQSTPMKFDNWLAAIVVDKPRSPEGKKMQARKDKAKKKYDQITAVEKKKETTKYTAEDKEKEIRALMDQLSVIMGPLFKKDIVGFIDPELTFGALNPTTQFGTEMHTKKLTKKSKLVGTEPNQGMAPASYKNMKRRRKDSGPYYILGHLLNQQVGGSGDDYRNLTPLTGKANATHRDMVEQNVKKAVESGLMVDYLVKPTYNLTTPSPWSASEAAKIPPGEDLKEILSIRKDERNVPSSLSCTALYVDPATVKQTKIVTKTIDNKVDQRPESYYLTERTKDPVYLDSGSAKKIEKGIDNMTEDWAKAIVKIMKDRGGVRFASYQQLIEYKLNGKFVFSKRERDKLNVILAPTYIKLYTT
ncbi:eCIS core domain-containing protein [Chitinophaga sp.]|uniref:eCIS core domain-containing protein n=1 Tax=Chitinophaga sp. TaxID=1869181 RepID=UPI002F952BC5